MKINRLIITGLVFLGIIQARAQDTISYLSLKQSCQMGIERNIETKNAVLENQKTRFQLSEAQSKLYPQVEAFSNFSYYYSIPKMIVPGEIFGQTGLIPLEIGTKYDWSTGLKATMVLYNKSYFTSLELARQMEGLGELSLQQKKETVVYQVTQIYYLCKNTEKQIQLLSKNLTSMERLAGIAKLQSENGIARKVDYSRVMVNKANLQTQIDNLTLLYQQQLGMLKYLIGAGADTEVALSDSIIPDNLILKTREEEFSKRSEIQLLDNQIVLTNLSRKSTQEANLPSLSLFGQYYFQGQRNEFDFFEGGDDKFFKVGFVGLNLSIPIFGGFEKRSKSKQYDIELMQLKNTLENTQQFFSKEYANAVKQYSNSIVAIGRQQQNIEVAEETYELSLLGYKQQVVPLSDLLLSESSLTEARLSYYNALLQLKNAELDLKKAKGELLNF